MRPAISGIGFRVDKYSVVLTGKQGAAVLCYTRKLSLQDLTLMALQVATAQNYMQPVWYSLMLSRPTFLSGKLSYWGAEQAHASALSP